MGEFRTVISANIPISIAEELKNKTKGTRSRVVARALKAYLADKEAFDISDVATNDLFLELYHRKELNETQKHLIRQIYLEVKE